LNQKHKKDNHSRDRPIYRPGRYLDFTAISAKKADFISSLSRCWQNAAPHASRQLVQESTMKQVNSYFTATLAVRFHRQTDKIDHEACVRHLRWNKSIIGKCRNACSLLFKAGLHNSESSKDQIININLPWVAISVFHSNVEISL